MSRQEKKTRLRLVPPKLQLRGLDALTGSYPTNVRFSLDGRTGKYKVDYNDRYSVVFTSSNNYIPSIGFPLGNIWLDNSSSNDLNANIITTGSVRSRIIDDLPFFHFSPGQEMPPFHDQQQFAADAKGATIKNPFFATGSAETLVGEGFNSPLWSKNKIEIPIPVTSNTVLKLPKGKLGAGLEGSYDSPMAYYNFDKNVWEPIGIGIKLNSSDLTDCQDYLTVGFFDGYLMTQSINPSLGNLNINGLHTMGYCGSDFGFPYHPKYHATSSQTLDMSQYINEPFLLEKAVLNMGPYSFVVGTVDLTTITSVVTGSITTFFLLNQRRNQNIN